MVVQNLEQKNICLFVVVVVLIRRGALTHFPCWPSVCLHVCAQGSEEAAGASLCSSVSFCTRRRLLLNPAHKHADRQTANTENG